MSRSGYRAAVVAASLCALIGLTGCGGGSDRSLPADSVVVQPAGAPSPGAKGTAATATVASPTTIAITAKVVAAPVAALATTGAIAPSGDAELDAIEKELLALENETAGLDDATASAAATK
jgi:hypothetical protein